jgi:hypothetical protein
MAEPLVALGIAQPTIDPVGAFNEGRAATTAINGAQQNQNAQLMDILASGAAYALPQGPNGPVDPAKWNEVIDTFQQAGLGAPHIDEMRQHPEYARVLLQHATQGEKAAAPPEPPKVESRYDPTTGREEKVVWNASTQSWDPFGGDKAAPDGNGITITNPDGTTTQIGGKGGNAYDVAEAKNLVETSQQIAKDGRAGSDALAKLGKMRELLTNDQVYTGIGAEQVVGLQRLGALFGISDGIKDTESFNALSKSAVLDKMGGSLGTGVSNADRDYIDGQVPSLQNTKEGNLQLIEVMGKIAQRQIDIAKFTNEYKKTHGGKIDWQFDAALADWAEQNPMFGDAPAGGATPPASPASTATPPATAPATPDRVVPDAAAMSDDEIKKALGLD